MKKILHILHSEMGGTADVVFSILQKKNKLFSEEILFIGPALNKNYVNILKRNKIKLTYIRSYRYFYLYSASKTFFFLLKKSFDIILIHNYQIFSVLLFKLFFNTKIIYIDHKAQNLKNYKDYLSIFIMKFCSSKLVFVNRKNYFFYKKNYPVYAKKFLYIANPVNTNFYKNSIKKKSKKKYFYMGMASRINNLKLHNLILQIFLHKKIKNLKIICLFAGEGPSVALLERYINKYNLNKKIKFVGNLNRLQLKNWYKKLDLYIQASKGEAASINVLQALSMNVPVIASNVPGNREIIGSTKFIGKLFANNTKDLSDKILYFYNLNHNKKKKYTFAQRKYVEKYHNDNLIRFKYKKILFQI
jgi:glycosyltransferase involved in cell wall biosynthesis